MTETVGKAQIEPQVPCRVRETLPAASQSMSALTFVDLIFF
jgi:hypothetical protein